MGGGGLTEHEPDMQVLTPKKGNTQRLSTIHATKTPKKSPNSFKPMKLTSSVAENLVVPDIACRS